MYLPAGIIFKIVHLVMGVPWSRAVIRPPVKAEARFRSQAGPCEIRGGQSGTGDAFLWVVRCFAISIIARMSVLIVLPPTVYNLNARQRCFK